MLLYLPLCMFLTYSSMTGADKKENIMPQHKQHAPLNPLQYNIQPGIYQHYSGKRYKVIGIARHSETLEECVIYQALYGDYGYWVRPAAMFCETVEINGVIMPRFKFIQD
jgi:hypothetical protein